MDDRIAVIGGVLAGAAVGGIAAYLFLTGEGRRALHDVQPALNDLARILAEIRDTFVKVSDAAVEGRRAAEEVRTAFTRREFTDAGGIRPRARVS